MIIALLTDDAARYADAAVYWLIALIRRLRHSAAAAAAIEGIEFHIASAFALRRMPVRRRQRAADIAERRRPEDYAAILLPPPMPPDSRRGPLPLRQIRCQLRFITPLADIDAPDYRAAFRCR